MNTKNTNKKSMRTKILSTIAGFATLVAVTTPNYSSAQTVQQTTQQTVQTSNDAINIVNNNFLSNLEISVGLGFVLPYTDLGSSNFWEKDAGKGKYNGITMKCSIMKNALRGFVSGNNSEFSGESKDKHLTYKTWLNDFLVGVEVLPFGESHKIVPIMTAAIGDISYDANLRQNGRLVNYVGNNKASMNDRNNQLVYNFGAGAEYSLNKEWTLGVRANWTKMGGRGCDVLDAYDPYSNQNKRSDGYWRIGATIGYKPFKYSNR